MSPSRNHIAPHHIMAPPTTTISQQTIADAEASDYDSSADSDFAGSLSASSSDSETGTKGKKRKGRPGDVDSGDEGVIQEASKKKRKTKGRKDAEIDGEVVGMRVRRRREGGGG